MYNALLLATQIFNRPSRYSSFAHRRIVHVCYFTSCLPMHVFNQSIKQKFFKWPMELTATARTTEIKKVKSENEIMIRQSKQIISF
jgi:hypothetical protein